MFRAKQRNRRSSPPPRRRVADGDSSDETGAPRSESLMRRGGALPLWAAVLSLLSGLLLVGTGTGTARPAPPAADPPRQQPLRNATAGLFLHWGMFTSPKHYDCAAWEKAVTDSGWTPEYWVDEARKLDASYIVLATFHSRLGYARPWPSKIPGSCSTRRDFLGELIAAGEAKGVRTILYMTDDPKWHDEQGVETLDSAAYSAHKGRDVDLTTRPGFGEFSYDNFFEVMADQPKLSGFWIDNDNEYWERHRLYEQIRERRPDLTLSNNNEDTPIMDMVSHEQKTGMTPAYDQPSAIWTPMPRLTESCYKVPSTGAWWYDGQDRPVDTGLNVGRYVANAGTSIKSLMDLQAMVDGRFPPQQQKFTDFMKDYLPPIRESLHGVHGGGYAHGGMQPGAWNDGAYGYVTVSRARPTTQYVHVTTRPTTGDRVRLRDNGHRVTAVSDLRTGARLPYDQRDGRLTIRSIEDWDAYDTVLKVETAKDRYGVYPTGSVTADEPRLTDGDFTTYTDNQGTLPVSFTLDLGGRRKAAYLGVNQREWSPTHNRSTFGRPEDSARIKDYTVSASDDGRRWRQVAAGVLESARGIRFIDLGDGPDGLKARYLKLDVSTTWSAPSAPNFHRRLRIDEIQVGHDHVRSR
ncbi:alpha-L-fucosidase [Streptomyces spectabilis]|uniref:Alpha-L-fucosidase n=2 Tax=Streptomyces spectabilis TaxID=68270 RepID=A0A5P2XH37_STRST|nr:alpha-L-fucosidase [Streptomyces spectabilis]